VTNSKLLDLSNALDLHENVLHAEEQAIHAKDLKTIEEISDQKDKSLEMLVHAKEAIDLERGDFSSLSARIESIIDRQQANTELFRRLHIQSAKKDKTKNSRLSNLENRLRQAYRG